MFDPETIEDNEEFLYEFFGKRVFHRAILKDRHDIVTRCGIVKTATPNKDYVMLRDTIVLHMYRSDLLCKDCIRAVLLGNNKEFENARSIGS